MDVVHQAIQTISERGLAATGTPTLLMVSGGSDSTALAYIASELQKQGVLGPLAMLHFNHKLRGSASDEDAQFVQQLAELLEIPLFYCEADIGQLAKETGGNVEAVAREERYACASDALDSLCAHNGATFEDGRVFTAHTVDDRVENFYMRSIVGTGPGGFRSMTYKTGCVARPLMDVSRQDLRDYLQKRAEDGLPVLRDAQGNLWREDASNESTEYFRNFVRKEIVPRAKTRNPQLLGTLSRTMNLIADEDDYLSELADALYTQDVAWVSCLPGRLPEYDAGCRLLPSFGKQARVLQRRVLYRILQDILGFDARIETSSIEKILAAFNEVGEPQGGYVVNIQGDLAVSANKQGVLIEPMSSFRARRKRG